MEFLLDYFPDGGQGRTVTLGPLRRATRLARQWRPAAGRLLSCPPLTMQMILTASIAGKRYEVRYRDGYHRVCLQKGDKLPREYSALVAPGGEFKGLPPSSGRLHEYEIKVDKVST